MFKQTAAADFADDLYLLDSSDEKNSTNPNPNPNRRRAAHFFHEILNSDDDGLDGLAAPEGSNEEEEEEELEWLANKDAFPTLETFIDLSAHSFNGSFTFSGDRRSPVSVLASALPFRAPAKLRSKGQRRRRKTLPFFVSPAAAPSQTLAAAAGKRKCRHCESEETPQWRAGPDGPKTLCNACGVRFKSGRLVPEYRPANSPTFLPAVHSNSHRRIVEMRRQKYGAAASAASGHGRGRRSLAAGLAVM
ncbi:GATA transcription factor 1-like [Phalaenopsis equestris]|uniref:GATA transcription factor 1-like n=1 Tax=Phalaenopsis equestris TaxID=78828 RepID=UPI0009E18D6D|nr:GATA transcription factor 1-like [Phalaenopsis equestris]